MTRALAVWILAAAVSFSSAAYAAETKTEPAAAATKRFKPVDKKKANRPNTILLIDDFNHLYTFNLMQGVTQGDEEEPGGLIPSFTPGGNLTMGRIGHSLRMDYDVTAPFSLAFYSTRLGPTDPSAGPGAFFPVSLEGFNYVSFWIKTPREYPRLAVEIHQDVNQDHLFNLGRDLNPKMAVSSFINPPSEAIAGRTVEIVQRMIQQAAVPKEGGPPTAEKKESGAVTAASPAGNALQKPAESRAPRKSRRTKHFYYSPLPEDPGERETVKAMIRPSQVLTREKGKAEPEVKPVATVIAMEEPAEIRVVKEGSADWRKVVIPLSRYPFVTDWSSILEFVVLFDNRLGSERDIIYIDDLLFGTNYPAEKTPDGPTARLESLRFAPLKAGFSPAALRAVEMRLRQVENLAVRGASAASEGGKLSNVRLAEAKRSSLARIKSLGDLRKAAPFTEGARVPRNFLVLLKIAPVEPTLEVIRLEVSNDNGDTWNIAASLYDHQRGGEYVFPWKLAGADDKAALQLRVVASDIWGRSRIIGGPLSFTQEMKGAKPPVT